MNRSAVTVIVVILVVFAIVIGSRQSKRNDDGGSTAGGGAPISSRSERGAAGGSAPRKPLTPAQAAARLSTFIAGGPSDGVTYRGLETLAAKLSRSDLEDLIERVGLEDADGMPGLVRCALYAEWARRDPLAAKAHLQQFPLERDGKLAVAQAWYAFFSGWAETDALGAYQLLQTMIGTSGETEDRASRPAITAIFRELARQDPATAWKMVQEAEGGLANQDTVAGFFAGLRDSGELQRFLATWNESQWDTDAAREAYAAYDRQRSQTVWADLEPPTEERQAINIAQAWAQNDLDGALAWLKENGPGGPPHRTWRASQVARDWAYHRPTEALERLSDERYADQRIFLGHGIILNDPSLASEVMARMPNDNARISAMTVAVSDSSSLGAYNLTAAFPTTGSTLQAVDAEARHAHLLDAINNAALPERRRAELRMQLNLQNAGTIPGALEAIEEVGHP